MNSADSPDARRGFTLVELGVAMALTAVLATAAVATFAAVVGKLSEVRRRAAMVARADLALSYALRDLESAGGSVVPPALAVRPDLSLLGSGIVHLHYLHEIPLTPAEVASFPLRVRSVSGTDIDLRAPDGSCPVLTSSVWSVDNRRLVALVLGGRVSVVGYTVLSPCVLSVWPQMYGGTAGPPLTEMVGASVTPVRWLAMHGVGALVAHYQANSHPPGVATAVPGLVTMAAGVDHFEVALGYDFAPRDGVVQEGPDTGSDEWLYNAPSESGVVADTFAPAATLRSVRVSFVLAETNARAAPFSLLTPNGQIVSGTRTIALLASGTAQLRSGL